MDDSPPVSNLSGLLEGLARLDERLARIEQRLDQLEQPGPIEHIKQLERAAPGFAAIAVDSVDDAARRLQERGVDLEERMHNALTTLERLTSAQSTEQLTRLIELAEQAPNLIATLADTVDQHLGQLQTRGVDLEERMNNALATLERVTSSETTVALTRLLDLAEQAPQAFATLMDSVDRSVGELQDRGVDLGARAKTALGTLERATDPKVNEALLRMLDLAENAPNLVATLMDSFDQRFGALHERGVDLEERLTILARVTERLTTPEALGIVETLIDHLPNLDRLLGSGLLGTGPVDIVSRAGQALSEAHGEAVHPLGAFGLFRALSDSGVQHSLGFAIAFARQFGRTMEPSFAPHALPSQTQ